MQYEISNGNTLVAIIGGGTNLLKGTAKYEFPLNSNGGTQTVQNYDDETNYIQYTSNTPIDTMGLWTGIFTPEVGQVYTLSADVCGNGYTTGSIFHYEGSDNGSLGQVDLTNDWQRISNTFRVTTISGNWTIYADNSTLLKIKHIKIEKDNQATPWSPSPVDLGLTGDQHGYQVDGLTPLTSYTFSVVSNNGLRKSNAATVTFKTRGIQFVIPKTLTVGATISLRYQEYSLGLVPIGTEPSGMFGGGNQKTLAATVISSSGGSSVVELTTGDTSFADQTKLAKQSNGVYAAFNDYKAIYYG